MNTNKRSKVTHMQPTVLCNRGQEGSVMQGLVRRTRLNPYETFGEMEGYRLVRRKNNVLPIHPAK